eukprot:Blabericola_migrator_1__1323@NODE_1343_length_4758_cov_149_423151_g901_i0_p6_GENE_NODE_1343_length_4758_cov_149_423151_g901_i0NODE_1343_length_4758_cov_149_423151_g901_i0_p6_ORF_typecomplete_len123_score27_85Peptidase_M16_M/PF16187_5/0_023_NODE_1343_length_4758_cov_149_423151_g901_i042114579
MMNKLLVPCISILAAWASLFDRSLHEATLHVRIPALRVKALQEEQPSSPRLLRESKPFYLWRPADPTVRVATGVAPLNTMVYQTAFAAVKEANFADLLADLVELEIEDDDEDWNTWSEDYVY